jgi:hypothetical protein
VNFVDSSLVTIVSPQTFFCENQSIELSASSIYQLDTTSENYGDDYNNYLWSTGEKTPSIFINSPGIYKLSYSDAKGCYSNKDSIIITKENSPVKPTIQVNNNNNLASSSIPNATYQWLLNGNEIVGATSQFYIATSIGYYTVKVSSAKGCFNISEPIYVSIVTGINDETIKNYNVFPNPTKNSLFIQNISNSNLNISLSLYNLFGQEVQHKVVTNSNQIELSLINLPSGVYILNISDEYGKSSMKIIKE